MSNVLNKIFFLVVLAVFLYQGLHVSPLGILLLVYLFTVILFRWNGEFAFASGLALFVLKLVISRSRPEFDLTQVGEYPWLLVIGGAFAMARDRFTKNSRDLEAISRSIIGEYLQVLRSNPREVLSATRKFFRIGRQSLSRTPRILHNNATKIYRLVADRFALATRLKIIGLLVLLCALFFFTSMAADNLLFLLLLVSALLFGWDYRFTIATGIGCLIFAPIFLLAHKELLADSVANYAYYFFVIGVLQSFAALSWKNSEEKIV